MKRKNKGFTLIELVVVIAILGILAAVAVPKYIDLRNDAEKAADDGLAGGLRAATVMLYASNVVGNVGTNAFGSYWPTEAEVIGQMSDSVMATNWQYYTNHTYNPTTGVWTIGPT